MATYKIEDWQLKELEEIVRVSRNVYYGLDALMNDDEIAAAIASKPETCYVRMLKHCKKIINDVKNQKV
jgi:hypothetical protein